MGALLCNTTEMQSLFLLIYASQALLLAVAHLANGTDNSELISLSTPL